MKVGDRYISDVYGNKLEFEVDKINDDGTFNSHLVKVCETENESATEMPVTPTDTPVEEEKEVEPKPTTPEKKTTATRAKSTTSTRKKTTTKKTTAKK